MSLPLRSGRRYAGQSGEQRQRERRERLLAAGFELFARDGYSNCPVERICSQARISTRHFYQHFGNREGLLEALLLTLHRQLEDIVRQAMQRGSDPLQRALEALGAFVEFYLGDPRRARIGSLECVGVSPRLEALRRDAIHQFAGDIARAADELAAAGRLPRRDYHLPAVALVGATNELIVEWLTSDTGLDAAGLRREILLIFRALIAGSNARLP